MDTSPINSTPLTTASLLVLAKPVMVEARDLVSSVKKKLVAPAPVPAAPRTDPSEETVADNRCRSERQTLVTTSLPGIPSFNGNATLD